MGKGFNNYMCKKFFHPASRDNLKRVWMAEQQTDAYKKKQEELRVQYEKEQDLYTNKAMMSKESKEKLSVNFLYEPPPGTKKDREREDDEPEFKFEWQRKYNAPRESYCKGDSEIRDQPFGIQVRNVRCIKCHKWGHINTDKECPMYNQSATGAETGSNLNPSELIRQMREDGLAMRKGAVGLLELPNGPSNTGRHQLIPSSSEDEDHMNESELKFLEGLSTKKKLKLLRKLEKMEKKKKKKKNKKKKRENSASSSESDSDSPSGSRKRKTLKRGASIEKDEKRSCKTENEKGGHPENTDVENELYAVLGRKMDFDGPPQNPKRHQSRSGNQDKIPKARRYSRSISRERSRSKSPKKYHRRDNHKSNVYHDNEKQPRNRDRSISPKRVGSKSGGRPRNLARSRSRSRERRSRSREHRRRSRSPRLQSYNQKR